MVLHTLREIVSRSTGYEGLSNGCALISSVCIWVTLLSVNKLKEI